MAFSLLARNKIVDSIGKNGGADWFSLHTGDPGSTGASEATGSPYARQSGPFPDADNGEATNGGVVFDVAANAPGQSYTHWGRFTAATGGSFLTGGQLQAPESFGVPGQYQLANKIAQSA